MTQEQIEELKRLAESATPGPWVAGGPSFGSPFPVWCDEVVTESGGDNPDSICMAPSGGEETSTENMAFIAAARDAVPELIEEVERITNQRDELLAALKGMVYKSEGRYLSGVYGDTDVTDEVGALIEKCEAQS